MGPKRDGEELIRGKVMDCLSDTPYYDLNFTEGQTRLIKSQPRWNHGCSPKAIAFKMVILFRIFANRNVSAAHALPGLQENHLHRRPPRHN